MAGLTALDIFLLTALAIGAITGGLRGFVQEILSLAALVAALVAVRMLHEPAAMWLVEIVGNESGASALAFVLILAVVWGGGKFVALRIGASSRRSFIGPFDRVLGAGFGLLKALLIVTVLFMGATLVHDFTQGADSARPEWMSESRSYPLLRATGAGLSDIVAEHLSASGTAASTAGGMEKAP